MSTWKLPKTSFNASVKKKPNTNDKKLSKMYKWSVFFRYCIKFFTFYGIQVLYSSKINALKCKYNRNTNAIVLHSIEVIFLLKYMFLVIYFAFEGMLYLLTFYKMTNNCLFSLFIIQISNILGNLQTPFKWRRKNIYLTIEWKNMKTILKTISKYQF
jgi:hypothetical protein